MRVLLRNYLLSGLWVALSFLFASESSAAVYTLTIQTNGSGSITRNPTNSVYPAGSVVTVTATPDSGWYFSNWTGDASGNTNPLNVTMNGNKVITGTFQPFPTFTLTTATNGAGSISLNPPGGSYLGDTVVSATATPASGWLFLNWAGDAGGSSNVVSVTMNTNKAITAVFAQRAAIDQSPQSALAEVGDTVNFNVHAVGTPPLFYQWWFNNSKVAGATSTTLTLSNVQLNQEGTYSIIVTNVYGSATNSATLTITNGCIGTNVVTVASEAALRNAIAIGGLVRCCFNGTITLSNTIIVTRNVTLDARNRSVVISGNNSNRIFIVASGVKFSATNVVFANGRNVGQNGPDAGASPAQDGYPGRGAAIYSDGGTIQLISCTLSSNSVTGGHGGAGSTTYPTNGIGGKGQGGAIYLNGGSLLLDSITVISNTAIGGPGGSASLGAATLGGNGQGGAINTAGASVFILNCTLSNNVCIAPLGESPNTGGRGAGAFGGALFQESGSVTFTNSTLAFNQAFGIDSNPDTHGRPGAAYGAAIAVSSGTTTIMQCPLFFISGTRWLCVPLVRHWRSAGRSYLFKRKRFRLRKLFRRQSSIVGR
jgi:Divergent InlB B-repeat domain/Immunoglobulin I-set domain